MISVQSYAFNTFTSQREFENDIIVNVSSHKFTQRLDNFDAQNPNTYEMRYLRNEVHFKSGGPIFIEVGGHWKIEPDALLSGRFVYDLAKQNKGLLLYTEHRFYGKSRPTNSMSTENLRFLTVDQTLADLAHFINAIRNDLQLNATGGVILTGSGYGGTLATWFRQKYPHLVDGVWASSAPVQAVHDFYQFKEAVGTSITFVGGQHCYDHIESTFKALEELNANGEHNRIRDLFNLCDDFNDDIDIQENVWLFFGIVADALSSVVKNHRSGDIEFLCNGIIANHSEPLETFAQHVIQYIPREEGECISANFANLIEKRSTEEWSDDNQRQYLYQSCSQLGWHLSSSSTKQPFGSSVPLAYFVRLCQQLFGFTEEITRNAVNDINTMHGAQNLRVRNVIFTHGTLDPWLSVGVTRSSNRYATVHLLPNASHSNDLWSMDYEEDSREMLFAKLNIKEAIKTWLTQRNKETNKK